MIVTIVWRDIINCKVTIVLCNGALVIGKKEEQLLMFTIKIVTVILQLQH